MKNNHRMDRHAMEGQQEKYCWPISLKTLGVGGMYLLVTLLGSEHVQHRGVTFI